MKYQVITKDGKAKRASMETVHGRIETPVFMNVGTVGAIKGAVSTDDLREIGTQVELSNTYHLHVRTGDKLIRQFGGLGALLGRKLEHAHALDLGFLQKAAQLGKFLLGLARQADDQAGAQHKAGDARAQVCDQRGELVPVARTVHRAQDTL